MSFSVLTGFAGTARGRLAICRQQLSIWALAAAILTSAAAASPAAAEQRQGEAAESSSFGDFLAGRFADSQNDLSAASRYLLRALEDTPDDPALLSRTFALLASEGELEAAKPLAEKLIRKNPDHSAGLLVLGVIALKAGDFTEASAILERLPDSGLSRFIAPSLRSWAAIGRGQIDEALLLLEPLASIKGFEVLYEAQRAMLLDAAGRHAAAAEAYRTALDTSSQASLRLALAAGNLLERMGAQDEAAAIYQAFLAGGQDPSFVAPALARIETGSVPTAMIATPAEGAAESLLNLATLLSQEQANEMALVYTRLALALRPDLTMAKLLLAEIFEEQGRFTEALETYQELSQNPLYGWAARLRVAEVLQQLDRPEAAIKQLRALQEERPDRFEAAFRLGNILRAEKRFGEAIEAYSTALERVGALQPPHWTLLYFRGIALERSGRWDEAEADFQKALELEPEQPFVMNYLAYSWVEQMVHLEEAERMLKRAVELRQNDGYIVDSLGWAYFKLGYFDKAVTYLERATELMPSDPTINDHLGDAYWRVGRKQEARFQWRRALNFDPEPDLVPDIEVKLREGLPADGKAI